MTEPNELTPKKLFHDAADLLERDGWVQGKYAEIGNGYVPPFLTHKTCGVGKNCPRCSVGALWATVYAAGAIPPETFDKLDTSITRFGWWLLEAHNIIVTSVPIMPIMPIITAWNDAKDQTKENVIATMRAYAETLL